MDKKYYTINEVSNLTKVPAYTLRYWESEFNLLRPGRRDSGQRRYKQEDIDTIEKIKKLLYEDKYSISGAKKQLMKEKKSDLPSGTQYEFPLSAKGMTKEQLREIKKELVEISDLLSKEI